MAGKRMRRQKEAIVSPPSGAGVTEADLPSSYYSNGRKEFCEQRFNAVIHYDYYNCLYREEPPRAACASGAGGPQASSDTQHNGPGRKSEDP